MGKIAFVFPGQGVQSVGMGSELYAASPAARKIFDMGEAAMPGVLSMCFEGPAEKLEMTENAQICLFLTDLACAGALVEAGLSPDGAAGFSLGEIPAVCFAGIMPLPFALEFTRIRGEAMRECGGKHPGGMYALMRLEAGEAEAICDKIEGAYPANYNCPGQTVAACSVNSAGYLKAMATQKGGKAIKLQVNGAFHCPYMDEANFAIEEYFRGKTFKIGKIPVYANLTGKIYADASYLLREQVNHPVMWQKTVENMISDGFDTFIEVGPGAVLTGLISKIDQTAATFRVSDLKTLNETMKGVHYERDYA